MKGLVIKLRRCHSLLSADADHFNSDRKLLLKNLGAMLICPLDIVMAVESIRAFKRVVIERVDDPMIRDFVARDETWQIDNCLFVRVVRP